MRERGTSSVPAAVMVAVLVLVAAGFAGVGRLVAAHVQATAAADAAALAAAPLTFLSGDPFAEAARFARANGARLVACRCHRNPGYAARTVAVEVAATIDLPVFGRRPVRARAAAEFDPMELFGG